MTDSTSFNEGDSYADILQEVKSRLSKCTSEIDVYDTAIDASFAMFNISEVAIVVRCDEEWLSITHTNSRKDRSSSSITGPKVADAIDRQETIVITDINEMIEDRHPAASGVVLCLPLEADSCLELFSKEGFNKELTRYAELLSFLVSTRLKQLTLSKEIEMIEEYFDALLISNHETIPQTSQELRNLLTAIIGYMELLLDDDTDALTGEQADILQLVFRKATELEAAIETLTTAFDNSIEILLDNTASFKTVEQLADSGPILLIESEANIAECLTDRIRGLGYQVHLATTVAEAKSVVATETPAAIVTDLFIGFENGLDVANQLQELAGRDIPVILLSVIQDETTESPQLGLSGLINSTAFETIMTATKPILDINSNEDADILYINSTENDVSIPKTSQWNVTVVSSCKSAVAAHRENDYDLAIIRADSAVTVDRTTVAALRVRRRGRRMPVVLCDPNGCGSWYTVGGNLFVQRPLNINDLTAALITAPQGPHLEPHNQTTSKETQL